MKKPFSLVEVRAALYTWPVDRLFPVLDWLRVEALKSNDFDLTEVPFDRIAEAVQQNFSSKSLGAALTMAWRFYCNWLVRARSSKRALTGEEERKLIEIVGQSVGLIRGNQNWPNLLMSLLKK